MKMHIDNPYRILGVGSNASDSEIKCAYRNLVKLHHPDAGGDEQTIVLINSAWAILRDPKSRKIFDRKYNNEVILGEEAERRGNRNAHASEIAQATQGMVAAAEHELTKWISHIYLPINKLMGEIINPFPKQIHNLSADPYDDILMESFCNYLQQSQKKMIKINNIYTSMPIPKIIHEFGLSLYQCLSQVEDALNELERYTMGYVDDYLHDGREMLREAKKKRKLLQEERRKLKLT